VRELVLGRRNEDPLPLSKLMDKSITMDLNRTNIFKIGDIN